MDIAHVGFHRCIHLRLFIHESEYMDLFAAMIEAQPISFGLILIVAGSVIPGLSKKLSASYLQRRLLHKWHPAIAIYVSSMFFSPAYGPHTCPRLASIWPLAGFLHWHFKSILPSIVCHIANNAFCLFQSWYSAPKSWTYQTPHLMP